MTPQKSRFNPAPLPTVTTKKNEQAVRRIDFLKPPSIDVSLKQESISDSSPNKLVVDLDNLPKSPAPLSFKSVTSPDGFRNRHYSRRYSVRKPSPSRKPAPVVVETYSHSDDSDSDSQKSEEIVEE